MTANMLRSLLVCLALFLPAVIYAGAGEPIPLGTPDLKYRAYFDKVRERIKAKWVYPRAAAEKEGEVLIEFHIAKDGRLEDIAVRRSSGVPLLDTNAMNAVKFAEPFPLVPDELLSEGSLAITGQFRYQIADGFVKQFLR